MSWCSAPSRKQAFVRACSWITKWFYSIIFLEYFYKPKRKIKKTIYSFLFGKNFVNVVENLTSYLHFIPTISIQFTDKVFTLSHTHTHILRSSRSEYAWHSTFVKVCLPHSRTQPARLYSKILIVAFRSREWMTISHFVIFFACAN